MPSTPRPSRRATGLLAALAVPALLLTACGQDSENQAPAGSSSASASSSASSSAASAASSSASSSAAASESAPATTPAASATPAPTGDLAGITVGGTKDKPTLKADKGTFSTAETTVKVVDKGTGEPLKNGDKAKVRLLVMTGTNGATVYDDYAQGSSQTMTIGDPNTLAGISKALVGQPSGSRVLAAIPPKDGFGTTGQPDLKIGKDDTLVMLLTADVAPEPLKEATGTPVAPKAGFPTVQFTYGKPATITMPKTAAPTTLQQETLVQGTGPVVQKGQTVQVHYTGALWKDGSVFDSSFQRGTEPTEFPIGVGSVIPAWDKTLVGAKVGSRVVIVAPPAEAYGSQENNGIPANSTLVFVVDVLGAY